MENLEMEIVEITDEMSTNEVIAACEHNRQTVIKICGKYVEDFEKNFGYKIQPKQDGTIEGYIVFFGTMKFINFQSFRGLKIAFTKVDEISRENGIMANKYVTANEIMKRIGEHPLYA